MRLPLKNRTYCAFIGLLLFTPGSAVVQTQSGPVDSTVPRFSWYEVSLQATGSYGNPYAELTAEVTLTEPDGG
jgi:hypothetical protein